MTMPVLSSLSSLAASATATPSPSEVIDPVDLEGEVTDASIFNRIVDGFVRGMSKAREASEVARSTIPTTAREVIGTDTIDAQRRETRANTLGQMLKNVGSVVIITISVLMILSEWGFNMAPLLAGAGVFGVALGFGAQTLVADFLSGVFMLLEDQYGVGDIVDLGEATGTVEDVQLRVTKLRAVDGVVWWVRNGEVIRVGNMSQNWSRAVVDVGVAYDSDIARVREVLGDVADQLNSDEAWGENLLEPPEVWGVEDLAADAITVRVVLKTLPGKQWEVARELRQRVHARLVEEGIEIPFPQRTVWVRNDT
jgi:small-conductance mechanosensitive channel